MRVLASSIPRGDWGTYVIVRKMRSLARKGMSAPSVRNLALEIVRGIPGKDSYSQIFAIKDWLHTHIWFTRDPHSAELLYTPERMVTILRNPVHGGILQVDCDDAAILAAALGGAVGLRSRFVVVGFLQPNAPYRHIWTELSDPHVASKWFEMDVTRGVQQIPTEQISRRLTVEV